MKIPGHLENICVLWRRTYLIHFSTHRGTRYIGARAQDMQSYARNQLRVCVLFANYMLIPPCPPCLWYQVCTHVRRCPPLGLSLVICVNDNSIAPWWDQQKWQELAIKRNVWTNLPVAGIHIKGKHLLKKRWWAHALHSPLSLSLWDSLLQTKVPPRWNQASLDLWTLNNLTLSILALSLWFVQTYL